MWISTGQPYSVPKAARAQHLEECHHHIYHQRHGYPQRNSGSVEEGPHHFHPQEHGDKLKNYISIIITHGSRFEESTITLITRDMTHVVRLSKVIITFINRALVAGLRKNTTISITRGFGKKVQ
jgi:hypothetical protein